MSVLQTNVCLGSIGLKSYCEQMSYSEVYEFKPLQERFTEKTKRSIIIDSVCGMLIKPDVSTEASFALKHAALAIYFIVTMLMLCMLLI